MFVAACGRGGPAPAAKPCPEPEPSPEVVAGDGQVKDPPLAAAAIADAKAKLVAKHGEPHRAAIERGVDQVASLWRTSDGELTEFCMAQFLVEPAARDALFARLQDVIEQANGHFLELGRTVRWGTEVEAGPMLPVDGLLASWDAGAHATDDLFKSKVAFVALLNFPLTKLTDRLKDGAGYSRRMWAEVRLTRPNPKGTAHRDRHIAVEHQRAEATLAEPLVAGPD